MKKKSLLNIIIAIIVSIVGLTLNSGTTDAATTLSLVSPFRVASYVSQGYNTVAHGGNDNNRADLMTFDLTFNGAKAGTSVFAVVSGDVWYTSGCSVVLREKNGYFISYYHVKPKVVKGAQVIAGQTIVATLADITKECKPATGVHVHLMVDRWGGAGAAPRAFPFRSNWQAAPFVTLCGKSYPYKGNQYSNQYRNTVISPCNPIAPTATRTPTKIVPPVFTPTPTPTGVSPTPTIHLREQIYWNEIHSGSVDTLNFEKWPFLFTDWRAYTLSLTRTSGNAVFRLKVFNSNGQAMVSSQGSPNIFVTGLYQPANYYAIVEAANGSGTYNITITQPPVTTREQLLWNQVYSGSVSASSFEKWPFLFTTTRHFQINLTRTGGDATFRLLVLDSAGQFKISGEGANASVSDTFAAGNYSVLVEPVSGSGSYTITIIQLP